MSKAQRLLNVLMTLNAGQKTTLKELTKEFRVSKRTMLRDLQELSELGVPLYSELGVHGGYRLVKDQQLPPIHFSDREAVALFFVAESLKHYKLLPFDAEIDAAVKKFYHYLPASSKKRIDRLRSKVMFWVPNLQAETPFLPDLLEAALDQSIVRIAYESERGATERDIQCIGVFTMNGLWYCPAYCFRAGAFRTFRVDRIKSVEPSADQSRKIDLADAHVRDWVDFGVKSVEPTMTLRVSLSRIGVRKCASDGWLSQGLTVHEDGTGEIRLGMTEADADCAAEKLLAYGAEATVEGPEIVRELMRRRAEEILSLYGRRPANSRGGAGHEPI